MTTNADFINDTYRLIGVVPEVGSASAEQGEIAVRVLNDMLADWSAQGVDINSTPIENLTDDCEIPQGDRQAVKYNLAIRLYGIYPRDGGLRPDILALALSGYERLLNESLEDQQTEADMTHLPIGAGNRGPGNILTG